MSKNQNDTKLAIGYEYPPADEDISIDQMVNNLKKQLIKQYPEGKTLRQAHPKMHGCVKAEFLVSDNIPAALKTGIFKEPKTFSAYIRFSNANAQVQHDIKKDVRGMAIKVAGVKGEKLQNDPSLADTQDFILISHEVFMSKNVKEFHNVIQALTSGKLSMLLYMLNPMHFSVVKGLVQSFKKCDHILNTKFWSATPYMLGKGKAVKYQVTPSNNANITGSASPANENYLRDNMVKTLSQQDAWFDFAIQEQTDPYLMPVEDPTVKWTSEFVNVAKIRIPKQEFSTEAQDHLGNGFSFSPWHSLPEHRPIGGLNRARQKIYEAMSAFWHDRNSDYTAKN